jgi:hypothetical protein
MTLSFKNIYFYYFRHKGRDCYWGEPISLAEAKSLPRSQPKVVLLEDDFKRAP